MSDFPWAYIDQDSALSASGPTGSIQFKTHDIAGNTSLTGSDKLIFHTASSLLALTGTMEVFGTASANQINVNVVNKTITNFSASGDTKFGAETTNIHRFTGSVNIGGALSASGDIFAVGVSALPFGKAGFRISGDVEATGAIKTAIRFVSSSGEVYGVGLRTSDNVSATGTITNSSFISSSGEIFSAGGLRNSGTGNSDIAFSGTLNNKSFISSSGETFAVGGLRASGTLAPDAGGNSFGLHVSGSTDFKHSKAATDYTSISGTFEITGAADSLIVLHTQDTDALKEIAFKKAGTIQSSFGIDSDEHVFIENESTKDIILRSNNQNTIRIFGNQQAVEINGSGVTANATLDVNGDTTITGSLTVSGTVSFGSTLSNDVLFVSSSLTASKGMSIQENSFLPTGKKLFFTGSALHASASFMHFDDGPLIISGSGVNGTTILGSKILLDHTNQESGFPPADEKGIVVSGAVGGPGSYLGINDAGQIILTSAVPQLPGSDRDILFNNDGVMSASANLTIDYDDSELSHVGTFEIKSGSSPASAPIVFEVDGEDGIIGGRTRGKFYHVHSLNFSITSNAQSNKGRFVGFPPLRGGAGLGSGVDPYYDGAMTWNRSILNPSSGRVIMLMWRFEGNYNAVQALANPPRFFMRAGSILGNGINGNSFTATQDADGTSAISSVTASAHPGQGVVGGIDFRTGVGALTGHANITGSWAFGTGSMINLHAQLGNGSNAFGDAFLTIVCEYDHLDEYVSGSGN